MLLLALGVVPTVYAIYLSLSTPTGLGTSHFVNTFHFFQFAPAFIHIAKFEAIWLGSQTIFVVTLALMVHSVARRLSGFFRFAYYLPGSDGGRGERGRLAVHVRSAHEPLGVRLARARLPAPGEHRRAGEPPLDLRDHGFLDRRRRLDHRDVRGPEQHSATS